MIKSIVYRNTTIRFNDTGQGNPIVLLHGFMESLDVWDELAEELSKQFRVIAIDLPGHGKSGILEQVHSMELMADVVREVIEYLRLKKVVLVGHSMGGYVALEFLRSFPQYLAGLVLLHSTPMADTEERKKQRDQMIQDIKGGRKVKIAKEHVQKTFADSSISKFVQKVGFLKIVALNTSNDGVIAALEGMKVRPDYREVLKNAQIPFLYILGKHDKFIPVEIVEQIDLPEDSEVFILEESGHQGYIEERDKVVVKLSEFVKKCFK